MDLVLRHTLHFLVLLLTLRHHLTTAVLVGTEFLYPNFTASSINYIEKCNIFLTSPSSTFSATLSADSPQSPFIYSIIHTPTSTVVWSENFASQPLTPLCSPSPPPASPSPSLMTILWFTSPFPRPIAALQLLRVAAVSIRLPLPCPCSQDHRRRLVTKFKYKFYLCKKLTCELCSEPTEEMAGGRLWASPLPRPRCVDDIGSMAR